MIGAGPTMLTGLAPGRAVDPAGAAGRRSVSVLAREDLAFALAVILLGLLMMITRRNAVTQIVGFMSLENGLVLAATGAKGMPLVVEISVAFSILIAFIVFGVFVFRIRERFDTVDVSALDRFRGERREHVDDLSRVDALLLIPAIAIPMLALVMPTIGSAPLSTCSRAALTLRGGALRCCSPNGRAAISSSSTTSTSIWSR